MHGRIFAESMSIEGLFMSGRWFAVPHYQRSVAWKPEQVSTMLDDFWGAFNGAVDEYFLGPVTLLAKQNAGHYEVIDGQQRLTTLSLIFHCLGKALVRAVEMEEATPEVAQYGHSLLHLIGHENAPKIHHHNDDEKRAFQAQVIEGEIDPDDDQTRMTGIVSVVAEFIYAKKEKGISWEEISRFTQFVRQSVTCIMITAHDPNIGSQIFETLNQRGAKLEQIDLIKNRLFRELEDKLCPKYIKIWDQMRGDFSRHFGTSTDTQIQLLFNIFLNVHTGTWVDKRNLFKYYQDILNYGGLGERLKPQEIFDRVCLRPSTKAYLKATSSANGLNGDHKGLYLALQDYSGLQVAHPLLYAMFAKGYSTEVAKRNLEIFGCLMRRTWAVRMRMPTKQLGSFSCYMAKQIYNEAWPEDQSPIYVQQEILRYDEKISRDNLLKDEIFKERLRGMVEFEVSKAKEIFVSMLNRVAQSEGEHFSISSDMHIEHILPQNLPREGWNAFETRGLHAANFQRLGNLMLLSKGDNEGADQFPFKQKSAIYKQSHYYKVAFLDGVDDWTPEAIEIRQNKIIDRLCEMWSLRA